ncbi:hypothetical protein FA95DRAFT_1578003 [Auriscalpium vulgare]|uniref:Uncharacterized protein n=1 Tax=Auriscalpium vulgare TaxID=40419 RepID=A0ACB8R3S2_9AGAM|nr:hypothetical protein FA95DRAFT_1578003 [Auriscalpium vulgare]
MAYSKSDTLVGGVTLNLVSPTAEDIINNCNCEIRVVRITDIPGGTDLLQLQTTEPPTFKHLRSLALHGGAEIVAQLLRWFRPNPAKVSLNIQIVDLTMNDIKVSLPIIGTILNESTCRDFKIEATLEKNMLIRNLSKQRIRFELGLQTPDPDVFGAAVSAICKYLPERARYTSVKMHTTMPEAAGTLTDMDVSNRTNARIQITRLFKHNLNDWVVAGQRARPRKADLVFPVAWGSDIGVIMGMPDIQSPEDPDEEWITLRNSTKRTIPGGSWLVRLFRRIRSMCLV